MLSGDILRLSARRHPAKPALISEGRTLSYGETDAAANRFANALAALGIEKGDRIAAMCPNIPEYAIAHFGSARAGTTLVNLSILYGPDEIGHILNATGARLIVVDASVQKAIGDIRDRLPSIEHVVVVGTPEIADAQSFDAFIDGVSDAHPDVALSEDDPFAMTFTGGTTGLPKGATVTHRQRHISAFTTVIEHEITGEDVCAAITPLFHAVGMLIWFQGAILAGCTVVMRRTWDVEAFIEETATHGISAAMTVPVQLRQLLDPANFDPDKLRTFRKIGAGGAPVPAEMIAECKEKLPGCRIVDHYGQSETGPLTFLKPWDPPEKFGSVGRPALGVEVRIADPDGNPVAPGEIGELTVRGPFVFDGYFENPDETALYFRGGDEWGWTGDLATIDEEGYITLAGRSKDMIVTGGVNVYPREVEIVLERHDAVSECTVFGVPDDKWGEALVAYVVPASESAPPPEALIDYCGEHLARFKRPRDLRYVSDIPKTPAGKVQKPRLRDAYVSGSVPG